MAELLPWPKSQFFDDNGNPLAGGKLYSYKAGSSIPLATYADKAAAVPNANPVILNSRGEALIFLSAQAYKLILKDANDVTIWTLDNFVVTQTDTDTLADAIADAQAAQTAAEAAQAAAATSETNASSSATAAASSASSASTSASNAATSESNAASSASSASTSASSASTSASNAASSASAASTSATNAASSATAAATSASNAASSATAAAASASAATTHIANPTGAHAATAISSSTTGVSGTNVQANLTDLKTQIDTKAASSTVTTHTSASSGVHGVTGSVVGTSDSQTLSNKKFSDAITMTQISTPSNPSSGDMKAYAKSDGRLVLLNSSGIEVGVGSIFGVSVKGSSNTATLSEHFLACDASSAGFTQTLPSAVGNTGKVYRIKKVDNSSNIVTVTASSGNIDGVSSRKLGSYGDFIAVVSDGASWLVFASSETVSCRYTSASGQSISNNTTTIAVYGTKVKDSTGSYNSSTGVYTASVSGDFRVTAGWLFNFNATGTRQLLLYKNGSFYSVLFEINPAGSSSMFGSDKVQLLAGDTADVRVYQNSGGALTQYTSGLYNYLSIERTGNY